MREAWKDIKLIGLNVTNTAIVEESFFDELASSGGGCAALIRDIFQFYITSIEKLERPPNGRNNARQTHLHDPAAIGAWLDPSIVTEWQVRKCDVAQGPLVDGMLVVDFDGRWTTERPEIQGECAVAYAIDNGRLVALIRELMAKLP